MKTKTIERSPEAKERYKQNRNLLTQNSQLARVLVQSGAYSNINAALVGAFYRVNGHSEFKTVKDWNDSGFTIKKDERGFPVWGRPKQNEEDISDERMTFWPMSYLFSNLQVVKNGNQEQRISA